MAKLSRLAGSTSHVLTLFIQDSSVTTGAGLTGLLFNSAGLTCYYKRNSGTASVAVTLATITTFGTYTSGGFKEVDATNMPGVYEFHPPDTAYAAGAKSVTFILKGATNMAPVPIEAELTAVDNQDSAAYGLTRLDAAVSSRSTYAGADTAGTTTLLTRVPGALTVSGGKVAASLAAADVTGNLPADVKAVNGNTFIGSILPADLNTIKGQTVTCAAPVTVLASVGTAAVSTAQTGDAYARVGANGSGLTNVTVGGYAASQDPATLVLDVLASGHNTANTVGAKINAAASAGDPWSTDVVAGAYAGTQAGALMSGWSKYGVVAAVSDTGPTATSFKLGSGASTTDGAYVNQFFSFETGTLIGQRRQITGYTGATKTVTFSSGFTAAPSNADVGVIV